MKKIWQINFNKYTLDRTITSITMNIFIIFNRYGKILYRNNNYFLCKKLFKWYLFCLKQKR